MERSLFMYTSSAALGLPSGTQLYGKTQGRTRQCRVATEVPFYGRGSTASVVYVAVRAG
jgi:hypothetical protein